MVVIAGAGPRKSEGKEFALVRDGNPVAEIVFASQASDYPTTKRISSVIKDASSKARSAVGLPFSKSGVSMMVLLFFQKRKHGFEGWSTGFFEEFENN